MKRKILQKTRQCFIFESQYYMVETFLNIDGQPSLLRVETTKDQKALKIPSFIEIIRDVTHDGNYTGFKLAVPDYKMPQEDKTATRKNSN